MVNFYFKIAPDVLALIRKGFTMAQTVPCVIPYISAVENFKNPNILFEYPA
jgi:hypothetical protein